MIAISENITFSFEQILTENCLQCTLELNFQRSISLLPDLEIEYLGVMWGLLCKHHHLLGITHPGYVSQLILMWCLSDETATGEGPNWTQTKPQWNNNNNRLMHYQWSVMTGLQEHKVSCCTLGSKHVSTGLSYYLVESDQSRWVIFMCLGLDVKIVMARSLKLGIKSIHFSST